MPTSNNFSENLIVTFNQSFCNVLSIKGSLLKIVKYITPVVLSTAAITVSESISSLTIAQTPFTKRNILTSIFWNLGIIMIENISEPFVFPLIEKFMENISYYSVKCFNKIKSWYQHQFNVNQINIMNQNNCWIYFKKSSQFIFGFTTTIFCTYYNKSINNGVDVNLKNFRKTLPWILLSQTVIIFSTVVSFKYMSKLFHNIVVIYDLTKEKILDYFAIRAMMNNEYHILAEIEVKSKNSICETIFIGLKLLIILEIISITSVVLDQLSNDKLADITTILKCSGTDLSFRTFETVVLERLVNLILLKFTTNNYEPSNVQLPNNSLAEAIDSSTVIMIEAENKTLELLQAVVQKLEKIPQNITSDAPPINWASPFCQTRSNNATNNDFPKQVNKIHIRNLSL